MIRWPSRTFAMHLLTGFSMVGSVLTLVGIYGVLMDDPLEELSYE
jgi:hypothetical protein